jgi:hypothetical protein
MGAVQIEELIAAPVLDPMHFVPFIVSWCLHGGAVASSRLQHAKLKPSSLHMASSTLYHSVPTQPGLMSDLRKLPRQQFSGYLFHWSC